MSHSGIYYIIISAAINRRLTFYSPTTFATLGSMAERAEILRQVDEEDKDEGGVQVAAQKNADNHFKDGLCKSRLSQHQKIKQQWLQMPEIYEKPHAQRSRPCCLSTQVFKWILNNGKKDKYNLSCLRKFPYHDGQQGKGQLLFSASNGYR